MTRTCLIVFSAILFIQTHVGAQISITTGFSNRFQTGNKTADPVKSNSYRESDIRERYLFDTYPLGLDYQRNKFNLSTEISLSSHKLDVNFKSRNFQGSNGSSTSTSEFYYNTINYGYLGVRISPQRVAEMNENFDLLFGPMIQVQWLLYENEYDHSYQYEHVYRIDNPWTMVTTIVETNSSSTEEFDGLYLEKQTGLIGFSLQPRLSFQKWRLLFNLSAGYGFTARRNLKIGKTAWEDKFFGFCELGLKFAYQLGGE